MKRAVKQKDGSISTQEKVYKEILDGNGMKQEYEQKSYKKYLKQLIPENINDVKFLKSPLVNEMDRVCSESTGEDELDTTLQFSWQL